MINFRDQVSKTMYEAIAKAMKVDASALNDNTQPIADLGAKSVDFVHIISVLEDAFEMEIQFMKLRRQKTIGEMIDFVTDLRDA